MSEPSEAEPPGPARGLLHAVFGPLRAAVRADAGKIVTLQFARAAAALMVVATHALFEASKLVGPGHAIPRLNAAVPFGAGVDIFFVISGFVMVYVSDGRKGRPGYPREYLRARLTRIVPPYWFYTTVMAAGLLVAPGLADTARLTPRSALYSYLFFPGWAEEARPLLSLGWTLNYEVFFYVAFFLALLLLGRRAVAGTVAAFCVLAGLWFAPVPLPAAARFWFEPIILEFCLGAGVAWLYLRGVRLPAAASAAAVVAALAALLAANDHRTDANRAVLLGLPAAAVVAALALTRTDGGRAAAEPTREPGPVVKAGVLLGAASYTLYLAHPFVITAMFVAWTRAGLADVASPWLLVAATVAAAAVYAVFGYVYLERPLVGLAKRVWPGAKPGLPRPPARHR